ncbi:hypothetical protein EXIGLDRAFT_828784 [Exidia glandulosa HHB12029]|uniref:Uncharacterized protein n=1 Tax=Exidia glandulosa HHB12029 TaxID=1314781 RepID=A0A165Q301_EXIGL|nr:hypothetical protein EXIGLDRAFT_828784 [Exidia glandulosa HHB12029]
MADWPRISKLRALLMRPTNLRIMTTDDWDWNKHYEYGYWTEASFLRILDGLAETEEAWDNEQAYAYAATITQIPTHATFLDDGESQATESGDGASAARFTPQTVDPATSYASLPSEENDGDSEEEDHTSKTFTDGHAMTKKWAGDELICSCDARVRVGARGFGALSKHHQTAEHGKRLKRKIRAAVAAGGPNKATDHASPDSALLAPGASTVLSHVSLFDVAMPPTPLDSPAPPGPSPSVYLPTASGTRSSNTSAALVLATHPPISPSDPLISPITTKVDSKSSRASGTFSRFLMHPRDTKSGSSYSKKTPRVRQSLTRPSSAGK